MRLFAFSDHGCDCIRETDNASGKSEPRATASQVNPPMWSTFAENVSGAEACQTDEPQKDAKIPSLRRAQSSHRSQKVAGGQS